MALCSFRYIDSHESVELNQEPNFRYLGQPINSYFLLRHVALGWDEIRTRAFDAENATRKIFDSLRNREAEKLPSRYDVEGGAHGIARLHSLYDLDGGRMVREGVVAADIKNGIKATSEPSVRNLAAWDLELISRTAASNGLWNTAVDFYDFTVKKFRDEERLEEATFEMFLEKNLNITSVEKERRESIIFHDQTLVRTYFPVSGEVTSIDSHNMCSPPHHLQQGLLPLVVYCTSLKEDINM